MLNEAGEGVDEGVDGVVRVRVGEGVGVICRCCVVRGEAVDPYIVRGSRVQRADHDGSS